jgi:sRNA-binding carbon storage regulator CsrA
VKDRKRQVIDLYLWEEIKIVEGENEIFISLLPETKNGRARIGIDAPQSVKIKRAEVFEREQQEEK